MLTYIPDKVLCLSNTEYKYVTILSFKGHTQSSNVFISVTAVRKEIVLFYLGIFDRN